MKKLWDIVSRLLALSDLPSHTCSDDMPVVNAASDAAAVGYVLAVFCCSATAGAACHTTCTVVTRTTAATSLPPQQTSNTQLDSNL